MVERFKSVYSPGHCFARPLPPPQAEKREGKMLTPLYDEVVERVGQRSIAGVSKNGVVEAIMVCEGPDGTTYRLVLLTRSLLRLTTLSSASGKEGKDSIYSLFKTKS
jgi:hypothetical protein